MIKHPSSVKKLITLWEVMGNCWCHKAWTVCWQGAARTLDPPKCMHSWEPGEFPTYSSLSPGLSPVVWSGGGILSPSQLLGYKDKATLKLGCSEILQQNFLLRKRGLCHQPSSKISLCLSVFCLPVTQTPSVFSTQYPSSPNKGNRMWCSKYVIIIQNYEAFLRFPF